MRGWESIARSLKYTAFYARSRSIEACTGKGGLAVGDGIVAGIHIEKAFDEGDLGGYGKAEAVF